MMIDFLQQSDRRLHHRIFSIGKCEVTRFGIGRITGYGFILLGFYTALRAAGSGLCSLAVMVGGGLGFGLQNISGNFLGGVINLTERPIAIGDRVELGGVPGQAARIRLLSTTVVTNDNISIIVPNSQFIPERVINWSQGDRPIQFHIPVGSLTAPTLTSSRRRCRKSPRATSMCRRSPRSACSSSSSASVRSTSSSRAGPGTRCVPRGRCAPTPWSSNPALRLNRPPRKTARRTLPARHHFSSWPNPPPLPASP